MKNSDLHNRINANAKSGCNLYKWCLDVWRKNDNVKSRYTTFGYFMKIISLTINN